MKALITILVMFTATNATARGSVKPEQIVGLWNPNDGYRWNIPKYHLKVNPDFSAIYYNSEYEFKCPKEHFSFKNDIYQFRCFSGNNEVKRLSVGGWGPVLFGFEYWIGGSPDTLTDIYGGGPVGFDRDGAYSRK